MEFHRFLVLRSAEGASRRRAVEMGRADPLRKSESHAMLPAVAGTEPAHCGTGRGQRRTKRHFRLGVTGTH